MSAVATYENPTEVAQEEDEITIQIQNVVITINLNIPLDLEKISSSAKNAEYNPRRFQAVIMRIREPKTTALVFASGKVSLFFSPRSASSDLSNDILFFFIFCYLDYCHRG